MVANRRDNGLVPLSHGGRKVAPTEILVSSCVFSLILGSFENPVGSVDAQWIAEVAADLHKKTKEDKRYRGFRQQYVQRDNRGSSRMLNHPRTKLARKSNSSRFFYSEVTAYEQKGINSILMAGGF